MPYDYQLALKVLSENDKNRILCLYLHCDPQAIDWKAATQAYGAASVDSMKVMTRTALRKLEKASGDEGGTTSPTKATPKSSAKKRKTTTAADGDGDGVQETPIKKKRGGKSKASHADADDEEKAPVKVEEGDDLI